MTSGWQSASSRSTACLTSKEHRIHNLVEAKRQQLELPEVVSDPARLTQAAAEIDLAQTEVDALYARWAELEAKRAQGPEVRQYGKPRDQDMSRSRRLLKRS